MTIRKCEECPHSGTFMDHRSIGTRCHAHGGRPFERENGSAVYPSTIPDWCPLLREEHEVAPSSPAGPAPVYPEERRVFGRDWTFEPGTFDSEGIPDGPDLYRLHLDENEEGIEIVTMGGDHHWWFENMPESGDIEAALVDWLSALLSLIPPAQVVGAMGEEVKLRILDALRQWRRQNLVQDQCGACFQPLDAERKYVAQVIFTEQRMAERDQAIRERDEARVEVGHLRVAVAAVLREVVTTTGEDHG